MTRFATVSLLVVLFLAGCGSSKKVVNQPKMNIAIMDFEARSGVQPGEAQTIGDMFSSLLQQTGRFTVVDRKQITTLMQEQGFQASQEGDAAKAGKVMAVRKMFFGSIGKLGKDVFVVNIKMSDVETSSIEYAVSKNYDDDLEDIHKDFLPGLINEIVQTIDGKKK
jgi:curli biogenesis system outer membrane secretion channel CsgG